MPVIPTNLMIKGQKKVIREFVNKHAISYYLNPHWSIHFIRMQRRYNKRRYLRVRAVSRPSFMAGAMSCCICLGMF
jgi:hypothetical protein